MRKYQGKEKQSYEYKEHEICLLHGITHHRIEISRPGRKVIAKYSKYIDVMEAQDTVACAEAN